MAFDLLPALIGALVLVRHGGVGGGNGMYLVFNRTVTKGKIAYELMSEVFDGDVEYCDSKVWLSK